MQLNELGILLQVRMGVISPNVPAVLRCPSPSGISAHGRRRYHPPRNIHTGTIIPPTSHQAGISIHPVSRQNFKWRASIVWITRMCRGRSIKYVSGSSDIFISKSTRVKAAREEIGLRPRFTPFRATEARLGTDWLLQGEGW